MASRFLLVADEGPEEHFPPRFLSQLRNQELRAETNLLLHTKISASPCVAVNWYRNGCKVRPSSGVHKYFDREGNATLAIVDPEGTGGGVEGNYTCVASNEGGENTISVQVTRSEGEQEKEDGYNIFVNALLLLYITCQFFTLGTWPASCSRSSPRWSRAARTIWWSSASCLRQERSTCQGFRKS